MEEEEERARAGRGRGREGGRAGVRWGEAAVPCPARPGRWLRVGPSGKELKFLSQAGATGGNRRLRFLGNQISDFGAQKIITEPEDWTLFFIFTTCVRHPSRRKITLKTVKMG